MSGPENFAAAQGDDSRKDPVRLLLVQGDERPPVDVADEPMVMTFPHLVVREAIAFLALSLVLVTLALVADAPLEEIANPARTPNPAKAPWYFLGLQELLHYYPPLVSGVVLPGLLIVALVVVPYFRINLERPSFDAAHRRGTLPVLWSAIGLLSAIFFFTGSQPVWPFIGTLLAVGAAMTIGVASTSTGKTVSWLRSRSLPFWIFAWFVLAATTLTVIGVFFRGPGWRFTLPWRDGVFY
jgi:hypothetical protein